MNQQKESGRVEVQVFDVVIVGAGMVGATLGVALSSLSDGYGELPPSLSIAIVDGGPPPGSYEGASFDPRVIAVSKASQAFFEALDVWQAMADQRACEYRDMFVWDGDGTGSIQFESRDIHQDNLGHIVENSVVLGVLRGELEGRDNITLFPNKLTSYLPSTTQNSSTIELDDGRLLSAPLIVAADGAQSPLRQEAGFETREWDYGHSAIVSTIEVSKPHQFVAWQRFTSSGPLAFLPLNSIAGKHYCSIVWSIEHELAERNMALDDKAFCQALSEAFEYKLGAVLSVDKRFSFPLRQRRSQRYMKPGLALVGDAAHTIHPLAGQGANLGVYDVKILAGEIERALKRGVALDDPSILLRYERLRKPHNLMAMSLMEIFKRLFGEDNITLRWARNHGLRVFDKQRWLKKKLALMASGQDMAAG